MKGNYKIVVAHPDDEILFFSSILKNSSETIICFGPSDDKDVTNGRQKLKSQIPLKNFVFLDLPEANVQGLANWKDPKKNVEGISVKNNFSIYKKNYDTLKLKLSKFINYGETIFTHNPWGEYGHEEHIQVFRVIMSLSKELNLKILVNSYVSNRSYLLMTMEEYLISEIVHIGNPDKNLTSVFKKLYQSNSCWTWYDDYCWPKSELFFEISKNANDLKSKKSIISSLPLNMLSLNHNTNIIRLIISKILPTKLKKIIKKFI
jgi:hypothetical protein